MAITDLTGYTWTSNTGSISAYNFPYYRDTPISINFTYNGQNYSLMFRYDDGLCFGTSTSNYIYVYDGDINEWQVTPPLVVEFTGGTGVTDATLIAWLEANGTLTAPITANTYTITHTLTNVNKGNITLQLTPDTGYELPDTITVTNGTLVSYDKTTGIAVVSGDDNTSVSAECVASTPSGYQVTFTASADWYNSAQGGVHIYDGQSSSSTELLNQVPANKSAFPMTFTISSGYCLITLDGYVVSGIASNDYSTFPSYENNASGFVIDKDGTIDIAVWDFDD